MKQNPFSGSFPRWITLGFTGHRNLADPAFVQPLIQQAIDRIALIHPRLSGIASAAYGADTLFGEEIVRRDWPLTIILPFACERFREDFGLGHEEDWHRSLRLINQASKVEVVYQSAANLEQAARCATEELSTPTSIPVAQQTRTSEQNKTRNDPYMDAGYRTIDPADVVIAVWDGQPGNGWGGTDHAVRYARETLKPLLIIHPTTGEIIDERLDDLKEQLGDEEKSSVQSMTGPVPDPRACADQYFESLNEEAKRHGPLSRLLVRFSLWLFLAASTVGYASLLFHPEGLVDHGLTAVSFVCVVAGSIAMFVHAKRHDRWLSCRVEAEVCRSFQATWEIRKHQPHGHHPRPAVPGLQVLFSTLRLLRQLDAKKCAAEHAAPPSFESIKTRYAEDRLENQIRYFGKHVDLAQRSLRRGQMIMKLFNLITIVCSLAVFILSLVNGSRPLAMDVLHFIADTLPLAVTAIGISLITQEAGRRAIRYQELLDDLRPLQLRLQASDTWDSLARIATEVEEVLLQELIEWRSFIRFTRDVAHPE